MYTEKKNENYTKFFHSEAKPWFKKRILHVDSVNMPQEMRIFYGCRIRYSFFLHKFKDKLVRINMNFKQVIKEIEKDGVKAFRPSWGEGELMWKKSGVLVHNTPYWGGELINQYLDGYPYVCEVEDTISDDWVVVKETE